MGYSKIAVKGLLAIGKQWGRGAESDVWTAPSRATPRIPTHPTPRIQTRPSSQIESQTPSNLRIGALAGAPDNRNDSQETVTSFDFTQVSATRLLNFLDSDIQTPNGSQEVAGGLTFTNTVSPTTFRQLALSLDDLEPAEETTDL